MKKLLISLPMEEFFSVFVDEIPLLEVETWFMVMKFCDCETGKL